MRIDDGVGTDGAYDERGACYAGVGADRGVRSGARSEGGDRGDIGSGGIRELLANCEKLFRGERMRLDAMAVRIPPVKGHPNRVDFEGVLTLVDAASDRAPAGARGHRVMLTREAAEAALPSLLGMAVDYRPGWDGHDAKRKIGLITEADVEGRRLRQSKAMVAAMAGESPRDRLPQSRRLRRILLRSQDIRRRPRDAGYPSPARGAGVFWIVRD